MGLKLKVYLGEKNTHGFKSTLGKRNEPLLGRTRIGGCNKNKLVQLPRLVQLLKALSDLLPKRVLWEKYAATLKDVGTFSEELSEPIKA